jgi:two-component system sensor histidine kinase BaeS
MRLAHTLSLMLIAAVLVTVAAMGGAMIWNLHSGFADYIQARDDERLQRFAQVVSERITQAGSLQALTSQPESMRGLLDALAERDGIPRPPHPNSMPRGRPGGPPPFGPPPEQGPHAAGAPDTPGPRGDAVRTPPPGGQGDHPFDRRVVVTDPQGRQVLGRPQLASAPTRSLPVQLGGQTVATVRMVVADNPPAGVEARFLRRQYTALAVVSAALLVLAVALAWVLARRWVRPLLAVQVATHRIALGHLDVRLQESPGKDEVADVVRNVNRMASALQQLQGARKRWLAEISHELRTPLTVLRGELDALADGIRPLTPAAVQSLQDEVRALGNLVDDLRELAVSDLGHLSCEHALVDLQAVLERVQQRFAQRATQAGLALALDPADAAGLQVSGDAGRLEQLLSNLLENSLRYTDAPGHIDIGLSRTDHTVVLQVQDSAPGVSANHLPHLCEPLYRVDAARSRHNGGSGLGLAICEAIVRAHGGTMQASHASLGGLCIQVSLPLA